MAKPSKGSTTDMFAHDEAAAYLRKQLKRIHRHAQKLEGGGPETNQDEAVDLVHDLRVGIRRVRTGLDVFSGLLPKKFRQTLNKRAHKLQDSASRVRDLDVWRLELERLQHGQRYRKALDFALATARHERQRLNKKLRQRSERLEAQRVWQLAKDELAKALEKSAKKGDGVTLRQLAAELLPRRVKTLVEAFQTLDLTDPDALHQTRIAAKKVRYTLEIFMHVIDSPAARCAHDFLKDLQSTLGDLRDCVVFAEMCAELARNDSSNAETRASLELLNHYYERRVDHKVKDFNSSLAHTHHEDGLKALTSLN